MHNPFRELSVWAIIIACVIAGLYLMTVKYVNVALFVLLFVFLILIMKGKVI